MAGLAGTAAITLSQRAEIALRKRPPSPTPAKAVEKVFSIRPESEAAERRLAEYVHWGYGTSWGAARVLFRLLGIQGPMATILHWCFVQGTAMVLLPALKVTPPVRAWGGKEIAWEAVHHVVYTLSAGMTFDALMPRPRKALSWFTVPGTWVASIAILVLLQTLVFRLGMASRRKAKRRRSSAFPKDSKRTIRPDIVRPGNLMAGSYLD